MFNSDDGGRLGSGYTFCLAVWIAVLLSSTRVGSAATISSPTVEASMISFTFDSVSNQLLTVQASASLSGVWSDLSYHPGTGAMISFSTPTTNQQRFFRVRVTPLQSLDLNPKTPTLASGPVNLPDVVVGPLYSGEISAALTGIPPYSFEFNGTPPDGVTLIVVSNETANAAVRITTSGAGLVAGQRRQFTVSAQDAVGATASRAYDLRIITPPPGILTTAVVLKAVETFSTNLLATNGTGPLTWSILSGPALTGIFLSSTGALFGTPTEDDAEFQETGRFTNVVKVTDSHTDRVTGAPAPRSSTNNLTQLIRLSYFQNIWTERSGSPSLSSICYQCHGGGFTPEVTESATTIIGAPSQPDGCSNRIYIVPGNPSSSFILQKLLGPDCGERMPQGGPYFDDIPLRRLERWIRELTPGDTD